MIQMHYFPQVAGVRKVQKATKRGYQEGFSTFRTFGAGVSEKIDGKSNS